VATDGGDFLIGESSFDEAADSLVAKIVKVDVGQFQFSLDI